MNYSDEFDVTSSSEASVEDSMDKEQLVGGSFDSYSSNLYNPFPRNYI